MIDLAELTEEQRAAATIGSSEALVVAGAGTGKTTLLCARARWLIDQGADPDEILVLVFTRSAAADLRARMPSGVKISTFHGLAAEHVLAPGQRVASPAEEEAARRSLYEGSTRLPPHRRRIGISDLGDAITRYEATGGARVEQIRIVRDRLTRAGLVPTWDLVPRWLHLDARACDFQHVLMDEYQDATLAEWGMARWASTTRKVYAVGDPRQSIFSWRGASGFATSTEATKQEGVYLSQSFRFNSEIARHANALAWEWPMVLGYDDDDPDDRSAAGVMVVQDPRWVHGVDAILCRTHRVCEHVVRTIGGDGIVHVRPDPLAVMDHESDRFAAVTDAGKTLVTTVHSAKGREWDRVAVVSTPRWRDEWGAGEEARVRYVASTRARRLLVEINLEEDIR